MKSNFIEGYNFLFSVLCFGAMAVSISYTFRYVRGSYGFFTLNDDRAPVFFLGAYLIACAVLALIMRALGPVAYSSSEIFWRYTGVCTLHSNPWKAPSVWGALVLWGLCLVLLATIFTPLSVAWVVGALAVALVSAVLVVFWTRAVQLKDSTVTFTAWVITSAVLGVGLTVLGSLSVMEFPVRWAVACLVVVLGILVTLIARDALTSRRRLLGFETAVAGYGRRSVLLGALSNIGSPSAYKFYGSAKVRRSFKQVSLLGLSLRSVFVNPLPLLATIAFSVPLGIFLGTSFDTLGVGLVLVTGCWAVASAYRWLAREWSAQASLRTWLGGSYLRNLLVLCIGPGLMVLIYLGALAPLFGMSLHMVFAGFMLRCLRCYG